MNIEEICIDEFSEHNIRYYVQLFITPSNNIWNYKLHGQYKKLCAISNIYYLINDYLSTGL